MGHTHSPVAVKVWITVTNPPKEIYHVVNTPQKIIVQSACKNGNVNLGTATSSSKVKSKDLLSWNEYINKAVGLGCAEEPGQRCSFIERASATLQSSSREFSLDVNYKYL